MRVFDSTSYWENVYLEIHSSSKTNVGLEEISERVVIHKMYPNFSDLNIRCF